MNSYTYKIEYEEGKTIVASTLEVVLAMMQDEIDAGANADIKAAKQALENGEEYVFETKSEKHTLHPTTPADIAEINKADEEAISYYASAFGKDAAKRLREFIGM